ncbi:MAG: AMP-binding protein [Alphaproteobacteria bacterium]|nr:AMP-binding protein [Alphaproteobacteria bacterium]MCD8571628.1 AMP-binding protein [Alphaproteobacteria bacterium]
MAEAKSANTPRISENISKGLRAALRVPLRPLFKAYYNYKFSAEIEGLENFRTVGEKPTVIIANHISFQDAPFFAAALPKPPAFVINKHTFDNLAKNPLHRFAFWLTGTYPVDFARPNSLKKALDDLEQNQPVVIFPEGELSPSGETIGQVMEGAGYMARKTGAQILAMYHEGFQFLKSGVSVELQRAYHSADGKTKVRLSIRPPHELSPADPSISPKEQKARDQKEVETIMHELPLMSARIKMNLMQVLHNAAHNFGPKYQILDGPERINVTYQDLLTGAYALGSQFADITEAGENVGVMLPNSIALPTTFYGLQAYGRVPAMLNPKAGFETLESCANTAQLKTIITSRALVEKAKIEADIEQLEKALDADGKPRFKIVYLEDIRKQIEGPRFYSKALRAITPGTAINNARRIVAGSMSRPKDGNRQPDDPALILFTSGSSGAPKGVVLSSKNILTNMMQMLSVAPFNPAHKVINAMPGFHAFGLNGGMIFPISTGMRSFQHPNPLGRDVAKVAYGFKSTVMYASNTFLEHFARFATGKDFSRLDMVFAGAEPLTEKVYQMYAERFGIVVLQGYGMTEAAPVISVNVRGAHKKGSVGKLLPGMKAKIDPVEGIADGGELCVQGDNVALGYLMPDNPGVLAPFKDGWLPTKDVVRFDGNGFVSIIGRTKRLFNVGGEQVQLALMEEFALKASEGQKTPDGKDFEFAAVKYSDNGEERAMMFTTKPGLNRSDLVSAAKAMNRATLGIPAAEDIIHVDVIPKTGTQKVAFGELEKAAQKIADERHPEV